MIVIVGQGEAARGRAEKQKNIADFEIADLSETAAGMLESADLFLVATARHVKVLKNAFGKANHVVGRDRLGLTLEKWMDGEPIS
jgi:hypothetical protein